jgi:hypothetical protein
MGFVCREQVRVDELGSVDVGPMSASGPNSEVAVLDRHVRSTLRSRHHQAAPACPKSANSDHRVLGEGFNSAPTFMALTHQWRNRPQHQKRTF